MAATLSNGYAPHQGYESQHNNQAYSVNGSQPSQATTQAPAASSSSAAAAATSSASSTSDSPKSDEVGWYFVEQYYTTLSRNPEKLYLFYNKRSQYVSGQETDKVSVCVGQRAIHERIKSLDFQECKVRVTNVDSQGSDSNIVIQVIGEISNKSQPHKKFTQTFVLAPQQSGFFVLNDIFRYLVEEEDEPEQAAEADAPEVEQGADATSGYLEPAPTAKDTPETLTSSESTATVEHNAQQVDDGIKSKIPEEQQVEVEEPKVNGHVADGEEVKEVEDAPNAEATPTEKPTATEEEIPATAKESSLPEKQPVEPAPAQSPPKQTTPKPAQATKPAAPKTWASLAASAHRVAIPSTSSPASSSTSQAKPTQKSAAATTSTAPSTTPTAPTAKPTPQAPATQRDASPAEGSQGDEWTAVGGSHNRNQSRQTTAPTQPEGPMWRGYIKNVHEGVDGNALKAHLETYGKVLYFDIARQKVSFLSSPNPRTELTQILQNCAFIDFDTQEGYNSAIAANPHNISDETLYVEERKFRPGATPYIPRGRGRGGPGQGVPRGGYQGRGGYAPRGDRGGRGGGPGGAPRGRGSSIAT